ncbi:hypothetical protein QVD17_27892 [Tagetes erecta]|uniref:Uncharacterized protein n=1 Tax=Tagetes erecta TaxID=13708 RepID=A0AAD8KCC3_TARER|nr:hypothetical protein QVD17_27892 [Tagetes erecta]
MEARLLLSYSNAARCIQSTTQLRSKVNPVISSIQPIFFSQNYNSYTIQITTTTTTTHSDQITTVNHHYPPPIHFH